MGDTKMLQAILSGQSQIREDIKSLDVKIDGVEERLTSRIDKLGKQLAYLEDDAPTIAEHKKLEKRVTKIEKKIALA